MRFAVITCAYCGAVSEKPAPAVNRARREGRRLFCDRECSGLGRRQHKTDAQKREEKRLYDIEYRNKNAEMLKAKKAEYYQRTRDPEREAIKRKARMHLHVEYCRRPEYRKKKSQYDRQYKAKRDYGEFWECALLARDIRDEALSRQSDYEIRLEKGTLSKTQKRKRHDKRVNREELEVGPLGNLERSERRQSGSRTSGLDCFAGSRNSSDNEHPATRSASS